MSIIIKFYVTWLYTNAGFGLFLTLKTCKVFEILHCLYLLCNYLSKKIFVRKIWDIVDAKI